MIVFCEVVNVLFFLHVSNKTAVISFFSRRQVIIIFTSFGAFRQASLPGGFLFCSSIFFPSICVCYPFPLSRSSVYTTIGQTKQETFLFQMRITQESFSRVSTYKGGTKTDSRAFRSLPLHSACIEFLSPSVICFVSVTLKLQRGGVEEVGGWDTYRLWSRRSRKVFPVVWLGTLLSVILSVGNSSLCLQVCRQATVRNLKTV